MVKTTLFALALALTACGSSSGPPSSEDDAGHLEDARDEGREDAPGDAPPADASPEASDGGTAICCETGQNLLACDPSMPWGCAFNPTSVGVCTSPACVPGTPCQGFNGTGTVVRCDQ